MYRKITTEWKGGMTFESDDPGGKTVIMDTEVEGTDERFGISPKAAMLSALASCSGLDVVSVLEKMKVSDYEFKMDVEGERIPNVAPSLFYKIKVNVWLEGDIPPEKAKRAVCLSFDKYCSVAKTLEYSTPIKYSIFLNGAEL